jgi:hypothetical protein
MSTGRMQRVPRPRTGQLTVLPDVSARARRAANPCTRLGQRARAKLRRSSGRSGRPDGKRRVPVAYRAIGIAVLIWPLWISAAAAQPGSPLSVGRFEIGGGARWLGATDVGGTDAIESGNGTGPLTLFKTQSTLKGKVGVELRAGVKVAGPFRVETAFAYHSAELATAVTSDFEGAEPVTATETLRQFQIEGGVMYQPDRWRTGRTRFFASAGAGYLRHLHQEQTLAETGWSSYVGAGLLRPLTERPPRVAMIGLRLEVRLAMLAGAAALDERVHTAPAAAASLFVRF